ncbi:hypothetical protein Hanom_Chr09g00788341 [Helianthus anomalus]
MLGLEKGWLVAEMAVVMVEEVDGGGWLFLIWIWWSTKGWSSDPDLGLFEWSVGGGGRWVYVVVIGSDTSFSL